MPYESGQSGTASPEPVEVTCAPANSRKTVERGAAGVQRQLRRHGQGLGRGRGAGDARVQGPRRVPDAQPGGVQARQQLGQAVLHDLQVDQAAAELPARARVPHGLLEGAEGHAAEVGGLADAGALQGAREQRVAGSAGRQHLPGADLGPVEPDPAGAWPERGAGVERQAGLVARHHGQARRRAGVQHQQELLGVRGAPSHAKA